MIGGHRLVSGAQTKACTRTGYAGKPSDPWYFACRTHNRTDNSASRSSRNSFNTSAWYYRDEDVFYRSDIFKHVPYNDQCAGKPGSEDTDRIAPLPQCCCDIDGFLDDRRESIDHGHSQAADTCELFNKIRIQMDGLRLLIDRYDIVKPLRHQFFHGIEERTLKSRPDALYEVCFKVAPYALESSLRDLSCLPVCFCDFIYKSKHEIRVPAGSLHVVSGYYGGKRGAGCHIAPQKFPKFLTHQGLVPPHGSRHLHHAGCNIHRLLPG